MQISLDRVGEISDGMQNIFGGVCTPLHCPQKIHVWTPDNVTCPGKVLVVSGLTINTVYLPMRGLHLGMVMGKLPPPSQTLDVSWFLLISEMHITSLSSRHTCWVIWLQQKCTSCGHHQFNKSCNNQMPPVSQVLFRSGSQHAMHGPECNQIRSKYRMRVVCRWCELFIWGHSQSMSTMSTRGNWYFYFLPLIMTSARKLLFTCVCLCVSQRNHLTNVLL
jgi:hypothetical protein